MVDPIVNPTHVVPFFDDALDFFVNVNVHFVKFLLKSFLGILAHSVLHA